jgi:hypothetical protein
MAEVAVIFFILLLWVPFFWGLAELFKKAGEPWWKAIVPLYNFYVLVKIARLPGLSVILLFIPYINAIFGVYLGVKVAEQFGYGLLFGLFVGLVAYIGIPWIGFGSAHYQGPQQPTSSI